MTERRMNEPIGPNYPYDTGAVRTRLIDRVRWSAVIAGLAVALATMVVLSWLGLAIGLSAWDPGDRTRPFAIGAGIWAIISGIISFFLGGWVAARTAAATGDNGTLNGTMVWAAAIPLLLLLFGLSSMLASPTGGIYGGGERVIRATQMPADQQTTDQPAVDSQQARRTGATAAWWTLASLLLGLAAAASGGYAGQRASVREYRTTTTPPPPTV